MQHDAVFWQVRIIKRDSAYHLVTVDVLPRVLVPSMVHAHTGNDTNFITYDIEAVLAWPVPEGKLKVLLSGLACLAHSELKEV